jgi:hypothetical protein
MAKLVRFIVSLLCLPLVYAAVLMSPCGSVSFTWPPAEIPVVWVCSESGSGSASGEMVAIGVSVTVILILMLVWLPVVKRSRSHTRRIVSSLAENLQRAMPETGHEVGEDELLDTDDHRDIEIGVVEVAGSSRRPCDAQGMTDTIESASPPPEQFIVETTTGNEVHASINHLRTRVDLIEGSLAGDTLSPKEAMQYWIGLLKECNDAHNQGALPTGVFKELNTRLLDLFTAPTSLSSNTRTDNSQRESRVG